jgi:hypothetical protein
MAEQRFAIGDGILLRRMGEFIHEAFDDEDIMGRAHAAPQAGRNSRRLDPDVIDMNVREGIGRFGRPRQWPTRSLNKSRSSFNVGT